MSKFRAQIMEGLKKPLSQPMAHMSAKDWKKRRINEQLKKIFSTLEFQELRRYFGCGHQITCDEALVRYLCSDYRCIDD